MASTCNKSLNVLLSDLLHVETILTALSRSKPMFRPTSCLVLCVRELLIRSFRRASCAAPKHKAHNIPGPHELGQTLAADGWH